MDQIESLASSLVREYLSRKGCRNALAELDQEFPRPKNSISNRLQLIQALSIEPWVKKNRKSIKSYKTLIEIIALNTVKSFSKPISEEEDSCTDLRQQQSQKSLESRASLKKRNSDFQPNSHSRHAIESSYVSTSEHLKRNSGSSIVQSSLSLPQTRQNTAVSATDQSTPDLQLEDFIESSNNRIQMFKSKTTDAPSALSESDLKPSKLFTSLNEYEESFCSKLGSSRNKSTSDNNGKKSDKEQINFKDFLDFLTDDNNTSEFQPTPERFKQSPAKPISAAPIRKYNKQSESQGDLWSVSKSQSSVTKLKSSKLAGNDPVFNAEVATEVRNIIFGSDKRGFASEWTDQGFKFNDCENGEPAFLRIGLKQKKGGPCGILSALQALILKNYMFSGKPNLLESEFDEIYSYKRTEALEKSIVEIVSRCKSDHGGKMYLAVMTMSKQFTPPPHYREDGITEHIKLISCSNNKELAAAVHEHVKDFEKGRGSCILLLYSAILTHGIDQIRSEMDEKGGRLLGLHGYCTQEMINLILQGRAYSNAFDNSINLGEETVLRGIDSQSDVGLLSLFEHYDSVKIGNFYKSPKYPIWLVCSESHFTVLFSLTRNIDTFPFDLYYYDGLANQDEVIRLTVDPNRHCKDSDVTGNLVPPIEHCIRTKWPKSYINWNDTDPIL